MSSFDLKSQETQRKARTSVLSNFVFTGIDIESAITTFGKVVCDEGVPGDALDDVLLVAGRRPPHPPVDAG